MNYLIIPDNEDENIDNGEEKSQEIT